jgi:transposase
MSQQPLEMNRIKQVQQLSADGVANKEIKRRTGISLKTIRKYLRKLVVLDEQEARQMPDKELAAIVYNNDTSPVPGSRREALFAHFEYAKKELHHTGVNRQLLWMEYREQYPDDGYGYSQYCDLFRKWLKHRIFPAYCNNCRVYYFYIGGKRGADWRANWCLYCDRV